MSSSAAAAGSTLGRYHILKHLASGGMAELYLARATGIEGFERYVVVKKILGDYAKDARFVKMFLDEARLAAQLHHQNIAQVYDCGQAEGTYYFAMEYVHGENVRDVLKKMAALRKQLPLEHALTIIAGAAAGLHHAHERRGADRGPLGIVHRDVSPSNLLVAYDGAVKVVDFGIAKAASRMTETRSGTLKGKIAYMSPEQCLGKSVDRRSDVFALGIVMYELTTVSRLFKGDNDYITMNRIVTGDIPLPSKKRPDYPPGLEAIVMKALALDAADRYQTAGELLEAIEQFGARERISLSALALGRYVRELFGEKPEPWIDLLAGGEDMGSVEITRSNVDSGVTGLAAEDAAAALAAMPGAGAPTVAFSMKNAPTGTNPQSASLILATSGSSVSSVKPVRRGVVWGMAGMAAAVAVAAGFAIGRRGDNGGSSTPGAQPIAAPAPAPAPAVQPAPKPTTQPAPVPQPPPVITAKQPDPVVVPIVKTPPTPVAKIKTPGVGGKGKGKGAAVTTGAKGKGNASNGAGSAAGSGSGTASAPQRDPTTLFPPQE